MVVVVALPTAAAPHVVAGLTGAYALRVVHTWAALEAALVAEPVDACLVDPALEGRGDAARIECIRATYPSTAVLLHTALDAALVPTLLRVGAVGVDTVLLRGIDDHRDRVRAVLERVAFRVRSSRVLDCLAPSVETLPSAIRAALGACIARPRAPWTVADLAQRIGVDRRTCSRAFARAGLVSPAAVLQVVRLVTGHDLLQEPGRTVAQVAMLLGYGRPRSFATHVRRTFGVPPSRFRLLPPEIVAARARARLNRAAAQERSA
jgi:AraC-like DNA-binding protein